MESWCHWRETIFNGVVDPGLAALAGHEDPIRIPAVALLAIVLAPAP
jgi:hypothetical protein